ncbi:MAG: thiamine pyrophosphate-dependent enzyme [Thermovirgaceae bacterium]|jgi:pyruvate ferredoxin oxidoreductase beta subunit|nr:thiamine pyrophosphate-dependent enzyme [Synergistales bacterium]MDY0178660.1 thiamine pyrophosphate-dependent enzyme [Synergistaceae bacterium]HRW86852.1 thiamine pyrophosphate-dependent enzyme [Thermovirgaceae bacterium]MDD3134315.1 thiamine pyrophosphate-dependent enzyme [Synergistales bacterium]MDD3829669.1 thiamine pyrophosphate-dependent enzyme [Synergistales bacterium]
MDEKMVTNAGDLTNTEFFYGHRACAGCGGSLALRLAMKVLGPRIFVAIPANCMSATSFLYPQVSFSVNAMISPFPATGAVLSGIEAGARALGIRDHHVVGFAGDGGTADIGIQALSGAIDRGDRIIYVCYDNEAYMNTGIQKSGLTPYGSRTTTTPAGKNIPGAVGRKKDMFGIVAAHGIKYAATASIGYPEDYLRKISKAAMCKTTSYIHVLAPCSTGWGFPAEETVDIGREAVDCGLWYLAEYEKGDFILNRKPKEFSSISEYLKRQARFRHLGEKEIEEITVGRDEKWKKIMKNWRV